MHGQQNVKIKKKKSFFRFEDGHFSLLSSRLIFPASYWKALGNGLSSEVLRIWL